MKITRIHILVLSLPLALAVAGPVMAQSAPPSQRMFVGVNMGVQPSARTFDVSATPIVYGENAPTNALEGVDGSAVLDFSGGYRITSNLWIAAGLTTTMSTKSEARVVSQIPDPLLYDRRITREASLTDLEHSERFINLSVVWSVPLVSRLDAAVVAGPSFVHVSQDVVQNVDVLLGTQNATAVVEQVSSSTVGAHFGGDVTYAVSHGVGLGVMIRYVVAKAELDSVDDLKVGGFQYGAGVRVIF